MRRGLLFCLLLPVTLLFISCDDDDNPYRKTNYTMHVTDFPKELGFNWEFFVYDSLTSTSKTVNVSISDTIRYADSMLYYLWIYEYPDKIDSHLVKINGDTVSFHSLYLPLTYADFRIVFPLKEGAVWEGGSLMPSDSCEVTEVDPYFNFKKCNDPVGPVGYHIERYTWNPNEYGYYSYWVTPYLGIVKIAKREIFWVMTKNETWEMLSFGDFESVAIGEFPLDIGTYWIYDIYDSIKNKSNISTVTITDSFPDRYYSSPKSKETWDFEEVTQITGFVNSIYTNGLGLIWFNPDVPLYIDFPLTLGKSWDREIDTRYFGQFVDSYYVASVGPLTTSYATYNNAYKIIKRASYAIDTAYAEIRIVPNVGIVQLEYHYYSGSNENSRHKKYVLKEYGKENITPPYTFFDFPLRLDTYWDYLVYNELIDCVCTLHAEIVGYGENSEGNNVWFYETTYLDEVDTQYIYASSNSNTVRFERSLEDYIPIKGLRFPFTTGDGWTIDQYYDTTTVLNYEQIWLQRGKSFKGYKLLTTLWCGPECGHQEYDWYVSHIGLVKKDIYEVEYDMQAQQEVVQKDETWELVDYYIPPGDVFTE